MSDELDLARLRETARAIAERAKSDPVYRQQINDDPMGTLTAAGIPAGAVPNLLREQGDPPEVEGHRACVDLTCIISHCPGSCFVTCTTAEMF